MNSQTATRLEIALEPQLLNFFLPIFQQGILIRGVLGCSIRSFLHTYAGLADTYIDQRIQTFFLNHKPVDNIDTTLVRDQDTLALSTAMPGLLGAILRKGSYYAEMRRSISQQEQQQSTGAHEGTVRLRLFNFLIKEIGPNLLKQGVWVAESDLRPCLENWAAAALQEAPEIRVDDEPRKMEELVLVHWQKEVFLKVLETKV
jgi:hypothetical protein